MENFKKYLRTFHLPWSPGATSDDKIAPTVDGFIGRECCLTIKMDGENTTLYHNGIHARSLDYSYHESRSWAQQMHGEIAHLIPPDIRIVGENLYARHSIHYQSLDNYFMVISIWRGETCLSWDETVDIANKLGLTMVPLIYRGVWDEKLFKTAFMPFEKEHEGYVVRLTSEFQAKDFSKSCLKFVRKNHVTTSEHWSHQKVVKNKLKE